MTLACAQPQYLSYLYFIKVYVLYSNTKQPPMPFRSNDVDNVYGIASCTRRSNTMRPAIPFH